MPEQPRTRTQEILSILISLLMGTLIWIYVDSRRTVTKDVEANVWITIPQGWEWATHPPARIGLRIQGPRTVMDTLDISQIAWQKDLAVSEEKTRVHIQETIHPADFSLPPGVTIVEQQQKELTGLLVRLVNKWVRVQAEVEGQPADGYRVAQTNVVPPFVRVMVPPDFDTNGIEMKTYPTFSLSGTETDPLYLKVSVTPQWVNGRLLSSNTKLDASVIIQPIPKRQTFETVKVRVLYGPILGLRISEIDPAVVSITLDGPKQAIDALGTEGPLVYVDIADLTGKPRGKHALPCHVAVNPEIRVVSLKPESITIHVD